MKRINLQHYILVLVAFILGSCSKDIGNYDYTDVNTLTVLDADGEAISGRNYDIRLGKMLTIAPKVTGTLSQDDQTDLRYAWILDEDTVSKNAVLKINTDEFGVGNKVGKLVVLDKNTNLSFSHNFLVRITAGISKGSYIFTSNENNESTLVLRDLNPVEEYLYLKEFNGYKLGNGPINLDIASTALSATNREYKRIVMSTKEGENRIMVVDLRTFMPGIFYPYANGMIDGGNFSPSMVWCNPRQVSQNNVNGIIVENGKVRNMASGVIGNDVYAYDPLDYDFGDNAVQPSIGLNGYYLVGFDRKNERLRVFGNNLQGGGMFTMNFDHLVDPLKTKGHSFVASAEMTITNGIQWQVLTRKGSEIAMHNVILSYDDFDVKSVTTSSSRVVPEMVDAVGFVFSGQYWYFAKGRTIYQCSPNGLDIAVYLTLPDDGSGDITAWNFNQNAASNFTKMGIATYNPSSTKEHKGSYYLYDMVGKKFDQQDINVIDKAVDIEIGL